MVIKNDVNPEAWKRTREGDILIFMSKGFTNAEIGGLLNLSPHTVGDYVKHIYLRLKVNSRAEAAVCACKMGLV